MGRRSLSWMGLVAIALAISLLGKLSWQQAGMASPPPAVQVAQATPEAPSEAAPTFPLSGQYSDPAERFRIGIAEGYSVSSAAGSPLFEGPDGNLAYSLVVSPLRTETDLSDIGLVELAQETFGRGEGFRTQTFQTLTDGSIQIDWTGRITRGSGPSTPLSGKILARQQGTAVYLLIVAATNTAADQVPTAVSALSESLTIQ